MTPPSVCGPLPSIMNNFLDIFVYDVSCILAGPTEFEYKEYKANVAKAVTPAAGN